MLRAVVFPNQRSHEFTSRQSRAWPPVLVLGIYGGLFLLFDTGATLFELAPGVSPWYPTAGLNLALILLFGLRYLPAILAAMLFSGLVIADPPIALSHLIGPGLVITLANGAAGAWLRRRLIWTERNVSEMIGSFLLVAFLLPAAIATLSTLSYTLTGLSGYTWSAAADIIFGWWLGDAVGILTLTPFLLATFGAFTYPQLQKTQLGQLLYTQRISGAEAAAALVAILTSLLLAFYVAAPHTPYYYLCFLPVLWVALRYGLFQASAAVLLVNMGAILAMITWYPAELITEFQFFMIALALTGLLLGGLVMERQRATFALKETGRRLERRLEAYASVLHEDVSLPHVPIAADAPLQRYVDVLEMSQDVLTESTEKLAELNRQLYDSEQEQKALNEQKNRLLSIISHDLKNPLVGIRGLAEVLLEHEGFPPSDHHMLVLIRDSAQEAYNLLDDLLSWARLQGESLPFRPTRCRLEELITRNLELVRGSSEKKHITVQCEVASDLYVYADPNMTQAILRNLLTNAIKFTRSGGQISVTVQRKGAYVRISVADTGIGIEPERLGRLFRSDVSSRTGTENERGTGFGLQLCKAMVKQHEGEIWAESAPGKGSTFHFTLPRPAHAEKLAVAGHSSGA